MNILYYVVVNHSTTNLATVRTADIAAELPRAIREALENVKPSLDTATQNTNRKLETKVVVSEIRCCLRLDMLLFNSCNNFSDATTSENS